jgi:hypothetical protein
MAPAAKYLSGLHWRAAMPAFNCFSWQKYGTILVKDIVMALAAENLTAFHWRAAVLARHFNSPPPVIDYL